MLSVSPTEHFIFASWFLCECQFEIPALIHIIIFLPNISFFRVILIVNIIISKLKFLVSLRCGPQVDWSYRYLIKLIKFQSSKVTFVIVFGHLVHLLFYLKMCPSTGTKFEIPDWDDDFSVKTSNSKKKL